MTRRTWFWTRWRLQLKYLFASGQDAVTLAALLSDARRASGRRPVTVGRHRIGRPPEKEREGTE